MLAKRAGRSVQTISNHLAKLRTADLVRYDSDGKNVRYWLKHRGETRGAFESPGKNRQISESIRLGTLISRFRAFSKHGIPTNYDHDPTNTVAVCTRTGHYPSSVQLDHSS